MTELLTQASIWAWAVLVLLVTGRGRDGGVPSIARSPAL